MTIPSMWTDWAFWLSVAVVTTFVLGGGVVINLTSIEFGYAIGIFVGMLMSDTIDWIMERGADE